MNETLNKIDRLVDSLIELKELIEYKEFTLAEKEIDDISSRIVSIEDGVLEMHMIENDRELNRRTK